MKTIQYPWLWRRISIVILICIALFGATGTWYFLNRQTGPISEFNYDRDREGISNIFKDNWRWLIADGDTYDPEFMMKHHAPNNYDPYYVNKLKIKVLRERFDGKDTFIGFTTYYMLNPTLGRIQFVAIRSEFRGKRYGEQLTKFALDDLKNMGAKKVKILTRTDNTAALKLYTRVGFKEINRDDKYVNLEFTF